MGRRSVVATLLWVSTLSVMAGATVAPALPGLAAHFAATPGVALLSRLVLTLPSLAVALLAAAAGALSDRVPRRHILLAAVVLYALAGASGFVVDDLAAILAGRAVLGVAVAAIMPASTALLGDYFQGAERDRVMGRQSAAMSLGGLLYVAVAGVLADLSWRAPFLIYLVGLATVPALLRLPRPPPRTPRRAPGHAAPGERFPWRIAAPLYLAAGLGFVAMYAVPVHLPFFLREIGVTDATRAGLAIGFTAVSSGAVSFSLAPLKRRLGQRTLLAAGFVLLGAGLALLGAAAGYGQVVAAAALVGAGMGAIMPTVGLWLLAVTPEPRRGRAIGGMTGAVFLGQAVSPVLTFPLAMPYGLAGMFILVGAAAVVVGLGLAVVLRGGRVPAPAAQR